ncbi:MAG: hypothetical protein AAGA29_02180 [Planctomycetota bacterium]
MPAVPAVTPAGPVPAVPVAAGAWTTDLGCPECGYNLRGLPFVTAGAAGSATLLVDCPECGVRSDLGQLAQRRWDRPWYKAPGVNLITGPVAFLLLASVGSLVAFGLVNAAHSSAGGTTMMLITMLLSIFVLAGWTGMLAWVYARCGGVVGVLFSLLAHLIFVGYLAGLTLVVSGVVTTIFFLQDPTQGRSASGSAIPEIALGIGMFIGGVILFIVGRICEKQVAGHCIRLYLKRGTTG